MKAKNGQILRQDRLSHQALNQLDRGRTLVVATLSPIEVHGPHLPMGQDIFEAYMLAEKTAEALAAQRPDWNFLLLHPVPIATDCVPKMGSINYPVSLVREVAYYTLRPFAAHGFTRLAYSSFHGGPRHITAMEAAAEQLQNEYKTVAAVSLFAAVLNQLEEGRIFYDCIEDAPDRKISLDQVRMDHHAGFVETSVGLELWPELVDDGWADLPPSVPETDTSERKANSSFLYGYAKKAAIVDHLRRVKWTAEAVGRSVKHFRQTTYYGYPAYASAEQGRRMIEHLVKVCAQVASDFLDQGRAMDGHSPLWKYRHIFLSDTVNLVTDKYLKVYSE